MEDKYRKQNKAWSLSHPLAFSQHENAVVFASLGLLLLIGWLDYITGYEFGFFIFYFIPVAAAAWYHSRRLGLATAVASAICWYLSDKYTHHPYSKAYLIYWEMFMRLISFLTTSLTLSRLRELVLNEEKIISELLIAREELERYRNFIRPRVSNHMEFSENYVTYDKSRLEAKS